MPRIRTISAIGLLFALLVPIRNVHSLDVSNVDLTVTAIQTAVNRVAAAGGGTVYLIAGTSTVLTSTIWVPGGVSIIGAGSPMTTQGADHKWGPEPTTILISDVSSFILYNGSGHAKVTSSARVANIKFVVPAGASGKYLLSMNSIPNARIDHCTFNSTGSQIDSSGRSVYYQVNMSSMYSDPTVATTGVIDHCNFIFGGYGVHVGPRIWIENKPLGTADAVFVEDCYFEDYAHPIAGFNGAHWVFRYNYVAQPHCFGMLDAHGPTFEQLGGTYSSQVHGTNVTETYRNKFYAPSTLKPLCWTTFRPRSGKGVVWGNTMVNFRHAIIFTVDSDTCTYNGLDAPHDFYIWENTLLNVIPDVAGPCANGLYWNDGAYCSKTYITCGPGGIMVNTAMPGYTPYTYPHPLRGGGTTYQSPTSNPPPNPPENLRIIKP